MQIPSPVCLKRKGLQVPCAEKGVEQLNFTNTLLEHYLNHFAKLCYLLTGIYADFLIQQFYS